MSGEARKPFHVDVVHSSNGSNSIIMTLTGAIDLAAAPKLSEELNVLAGFAGLHLRVDLSEVTFMDSDGISALVRAAKALRLNHGKMTLVAPHATVQRLADIDHLSEFASIEES